MSDPSGSLPAPRLFGLSVGAAGVIYGDIGTSPIYALRESLHSHGVEPSPATILGILSLIFWALILVISTKYLLLVLRADNHGEGGILALTALVSPRSPSQPARGVWRLLIVLGLFGAALFYGDGMITPAISVLSAVEGLQVITPAFEPYVLPITLAILVTLFAVQSRGTARVAAVFGPVMILWFLTLAVLGAGEVIRNPQVLAAVDPGHAVRFFAEHRVDGFLVLGTVFLVVTGGEALYADMGHFGRLPIRLTWFSLVLPALLLNYFGQGALILRDAAAAEQPFFLLAPRWALFPLVGLSAAATVIASQAVISGVFSLTRQAVLLGYLPRMRIDHTSPSIIGQIYVPGVNWALMLSCVCLVLAFGSSGALAGAYGVAVTTHMLITTLLFAAAAWRYWGVNPAILALMTSALLCIDLAFWTANLHKIPDGGWFPLVAAAAIFIIMTTWRTGRLILTKRQQDRTFPVELFVDDVRRHPPIRVPGTAIYLDSNADGTPPALLHNLKHNQVLHERTIFLTILIDESPTVSELDRFETVPLGAGMYRLRIRVGFMEVADIPALLKRCAIDEAPFDPMQTSFFLGRERLIASQQPGMAMWRERLFALMTRNAEGATRFFHLPPNRVVEVGMQVEL